MNQVKPHGNPSLNLCLKVIYSDLESRETAGGGKLEASTQGFPYFVDGSLDSKQESDRNLNDRSARPYLVAEDVMAVAIVVLLFYRGLKARTTFNIGKLDASNRVWSWSRREFLFVPCWEVYR